MWKDVSMMKQCCKCNGTVLLYYNCASNKNFEMTQTWWNKIYKCKATIWWTKEHKEQRHIKTPFMTLIWCFVCWI